MKNHIIITDFQKRTFAALGEWSGRVIEDLAFVECVFHSCYLGVREMGHRPVLRRLTLERCQLLGHGGCTLKGAIVEDVLVKGLKTDGMVQTWATVFKHVMFKGKIGRLMFSELFTPCDPPTSKFQQAIAKANAEYYATVDWALDIREAEFDDFDCRGVPSRLVRRNPETQMMLTRQRVLEHRDSMGAGGEYWERLVKLFLQRADGYGGPMEDAICIVPRQGVDRKALIAGIEVLRKAGVAEPD